MKTSIVLKHSCNFENNAIKRTSLKFFFGLLKSFSTKLGLRIHSTATNSYNLIPNVQNLNPLSILQTDQSSELTYMDVESIHTFKSMRISNKKIVVDSKNCCKPNDWRLLHTVLDLRRRAKRTFYPFLPNLFILTISDLVLHTWFSCCECQPICKRSSSNMLSYNFLSHYTLHQSTQISEWGYDSCVNCTQNYAMR